MAEARTKVLIDSNIIRLTAGSYELIWGSLDPQQLQLSKVTVLIDETDGSVDILLPPTTDTQSKYAQLIVAITTEQGNSVSVSAFDGDTFNGGDALAEFSGYGKMFQCSYLFDSVWFAFSNGASA